MPKPNWGKPDKEVWLSDPPSSLPRRENEQEIFYCYTSYDGNRWWGGWKTYQHLWTCLRYGTFLRKNKECKQYIKNLTTNEIVWRSWEDENKYRHDS